MKKLIFLSIFALGFAPSASFAFGMSYITGVMQGRLIGRDQASGPVPAYPADGFVVCPHPNPTTCSAGETTFHDGKNVSWVEYIKMITGISGATVAGLAFNDSTGNAIIYFRKPETIKPESAKK